MQFVSGDPNLVDTTRLWAADSSAAPRTTWTDEEVKNLVNGSYLELRELARIQDTGYARKITSVDVTAGLSEYPKPTDMIAIIQAELSLDGEDLSLVDTISKASSFLRIVETDVALAEYHSGRANGSEMISVKDKSLLIVNPPPTTGTGSLRLLYDASTPELVADADEPTLPPEYHRLLAMNAAVQLLVTRGKNADDLQALVDRRMPAFLAAMHETSRDHQSQVSVSTLVNQQWATPMGSMS